MKFQISKSESLIAAEVNLVAALNALMRNCAAITEAMKKSNIMGADINNAGEQVLQQIGVLSEATDHLKELGPVETIEPEEGR